MLATNVAETSLTVPGIKYVIDPGTARISRYSHRTKVQRLPIEPDLPGQRQPAQGPLRPYVATASASGCTPRTTSSPARSSPTPEILRTNLASVILQMTAAGLGDIEKFPFIDPPDHRNIRDGVQLLQELGALDPAREGPAASGSPSSAASSPSCPSTRAWPGWSWRPTRTAASARSW